jgi:hypothetical protein
MYEDAPMMRWQNPKTTVQGRNPAFGPVTSKDDRSA